MSQQITAHAEYAYNPRQGARSIGREHAVLDQHLLRPRFRRNRGDALCRPRVKFWGLYEGSTPEVSCPRCIELAARYGVILPQGPICPQCQQPVPSLDGRAGHKMDCTEPDRRRS